MTTNVQGTNRAVFLDRDGVINEERGYVFSIEDFVLLPGVIEGLRRFQSAGFLLIVITNQSGIARGMYSEIDFQGLTRHMERLLDAHGVRIAATYYCPHHPTDGVGSYRVDCKCRKPGPGMLLKAQKEFDLDLNSSVLVGDRVSDILAGRAAGVGHCALVTSGHPLDDHEIEQADVVGGTLMDVARELVPFGL